MTIKTLDPKHYTAAFDLIWQVFREYVAPDWSQEGSDFFYEHFISEQSDYRKKVEGGDETCFGAYDEDKLVGVMTVSKHGNISCAFVLPGYQRKGIGRELFRHVCELILKDQSFPFEIKLNASPYAVPFYLSLGFKPAAEQNEYRGMVSTPMVMRIDGTDRIALSDMSSRYDVCLLKKSDVPEILELCAGNPMYYEYCPPPVSEESILADMKALPEGKTYGDKYSIGFYDDGDLIAVMDLIMHFPEQNTAWIGFFMTKSSIQHRGIGKLIIDELCSYLAVNGIPEVRLAYMQDNPQCHGFWAKAGFHFVSKGEDTAGRSVIIASRGETH